MVRGTPMVHRPHRNTNNMGAANIPIANDHKILLSLDWGFTDGWSGRYPPNFSNSFCFK